MVPGVAPNLHDDHESKQAQAWEHLRDHVQQDPPDQGGVQQEQGVDEDMWGGHWVDEMWGILCVNHNAFSHGKVKKKINF